MNLLPLIRRAVRWLDRKLDWPLLDTEVMLRRCRCGRRTDRFGVHREACLDHEQVQRERAAQDAVAAQRVRRERLEATEDQWQPVCRSPKN